MKLSYEWLKEYIDTGLSAEEVAKGLTMSGSEVGGIRPAGEDSVMELEITSNRPDCLNVIGLAREVSAVFDKDLKMPDVGDIEEEKSGINIECVINNKDLCPQYTARVIKDVKIKPAGEYLQKRLQAVGLRNINNVVDVTNFCLMEIGQPLHAFDLDKIKGGKIIVREAIQGEKIVTIDGVERTLEKGMLVIADAQRPVAIAGIMGGLDTEVTSSTKNILLESAYFNPLSVRRTARKLALSSDSSYRFERGVDKAMVETASKRAAGLIKKESGGKICEFYNAGGCEIRTAKTVFDIKKCSKLLGIEIGSERLRKIFTRLGVKIVSESSGKFDVEMPSFREDLQREVDLIEEVARIYGYENIPATMPEFISNPARKEPVRLVLERIRNSLKGMGFNEIMTYSLISEVSADRFGAISGEKVTLMNPLSEEQKVLTPQIVDGMMKTISWNLNRKNKDLMLFEVGKIYSKAAHGYREVETLCMGMTGLHDSNWLEKKREVTFYDLKGVTENVLEGLKIKVSFSPFKIDGFEAAAEVRAEGVEEPIGFVAKAGRQLARSYDVEQDVFVAQIKLDKVIEKTDLKNKYKPIPKFPFSTRDVSMLCDRTVKAGDILTSIKAVSASEIKSVELMDVYAGENIPRGKMSLMYSIKYGLPDRTLKEDEIEALHAKVKEMLVLKFSVVLR